MDEKDVLLELGAWRLVGAVITGLDKTPMGCLMAYQSNMEGIREELIKIEGMYQDALKAIEELESQKDHVERTVSACEDEIETLHKDKTDILQSLEKLRQDNVRLVGVIDDIETVKNKLEDERNILQGDKQTLENDKVFLSNENRSLRDDVVRLHSLVESLEKVKNNLEEENASLNEDNARLDSLVEELEKVKVELTEEVETHKSELQAVYGHIYAKDENSIIGPSAVDNFDFLTFLLAHKIWAQQTFGSDQPYEQITNHIRKELTEIEKNPKDLTEWVDIVLLATYGAQLVGHTAEDIIAGLMYKFMINQKRKWSDPNPESKEPIEHIRGEGEHG